MTLTLMCNCAGQRLPRYPHWRDEGDSTRYRQKPKECQCKAQLRCATNLHMFSPPENRTSIESHCETYLNLSTVFPTGIASLERKLPTKCGEAIIKLQNWKKIFEHFHVSWGCSKTAMLSTEFLADCNRNPAIRVSGHPKSIG